MFSFSEDHRRCEILPLFILISLIAVILIFLTLIIRFVVVLYVTGRAELHHYCDNSNPEVWVWRNHTLLENKDCHESNNSLYQFPLIIAALVRKGFLVKFNSRTRSIFQKRFFGLFSQVLHGVLVVIVLLPASVIC